MTEVQLRGDWRAIDSRSDWTTTVLNSLESAFESIDSIGRDVPWFDGIFQMEHSEEVFGVSFVVSQSYVLAAAETTNKIRKSEGKSILSKIEYYSDSEYCKGTSINSMLLLNSISNYYKHHEEWGKVWPNNQTVKILSLAGIESDTEFPCHKAAVVLFGEKNIWKFSSLKKLMYDWREYILRKYTGGNS